MVAWQIFWQSVLRLVNNLGAALKVSLIPYVISMAAWIFLWWPFLGLNSQSMKILVATGNFLWLQLLLALIISVPCGLWTAVSWHRYILLDEDPGWLPPLRAGRMGAYFWRGLLITIIMLATGLVLSIVIGLVVGILTAIFARGTPPSAAPLPSTLSMLPVALSFALFFLISPIAFELLTAMAGAALGAPGGIGDAWRATRGKWGTFALLALLLIILEVIIGFLSNLIVNQFASLIPLALAWQIVLGWVSGMVFLSILTTLYGHFIEQRTLG